MTFIGVDLGWYGKPTGLAALDWHGTVLRLRLSARIEGIDSILRWVDEHAGAAGSVVAVDAPLIIRNDHSARPVDVHVSKAFVRQHAGCHSANLNRPFAALTTGFSSALQARGYVHGAAISPRQPGRFQIEIHPHTATVQLFGLDRILKYKKGPVAIRAAELNRYRQLMLERLPAADPPLVIDTLPRPRKVGAQELKEVEDQLDAVIAAYTAAHWWFWGAARNTVYGDEQTGYIVVPARATTANA